MNRVTYWKEEYHKEHSINEGLDHAIDICEDVIFDQQKDIKRLYLIIAFSNIVGLIGWIL